MEFTEVIIRLRNSTLERIRTISTDETGVVNLLLDSALSSLEQGYTALLTEAVPRPVTIRFADGSALEGEVCADSVHTTTPVNEHSQLIDEDEDDPFYSTELAALLDDTRFVSLHRDGLVH